jgi:outer membrane biogenesis lipoprotein LolB
MSKQEKLELQTKIANIGAKAAEVDSHLKIVNEQLRALEAQRVMWQEEKARYELALEDLLSQHAAVLNRT